MEIFHLKAEERRWCSNLMHSDLHLVCKDGKVSAHSARLVDLSVYLFNLLEQSRGCSNCKEPTVLQLPDFYLADCQALIELIYKGGTTLTKTKVERVIALSRTLGIKLTNVFGDVPKSSTPLRFPIHGFQGDEMQKHRRKGNYVKSSHQQGSPPAGPKTSLQTKSVVHRTGLSSRSAVSSQALRVANLSGLQQNVNTNNKSVLKMSSSLKLDPTSKRVIRLDKSKIRVVPLLQEQTISRKRPAPDRIENVEDARRIKNARVLDTTKEKLTDDAIEEELSERPASKHFISSEIIGKEEKPIRSTKDFHKGKKINTRMNKKSSALASPTQPQSSVASPTQPQSSVASSKQPQSFVASSKQHLSAMASPSKQPLSAVASPAKPLLTVASLTRPLSSVASPTQPLAASLTRRAKQAPITQSKPGNSRIQPVTTDIKMEPGSQPPPKVSAIGSQKRMATSVVLSDRSCAGKSLIAEIATSEVEDKILAEIEEKMSLPVPAKQVKTPEKRQIQAEIKNLEKKDGNMKKCWFCDRECKELSVHVALHHFREQILRKTVAGKCLECGYSASDNEVILHIAFEHMAFKTNKKSFTPMFLASKGLVVEISEKEILKPDLTKPESKVQKEVGFKRPQMDKLSKDVDQVNKYTQKAKEQKPKPVVKEVFIVKKKGKTEKDVATDDTIATSKGSTRKSDLSSGKAKDRVSGNNNIQKLTETKPLKARVVRDVKGCGSCVKCKLPDCGSCVFCQNKNSNGGGKGLLMKVCVKKVCRNRSNTL